MPQIGEIDELKKRIAELERDNKALFAELTCRAESLQELIPQFFRVNEVPSFDGGNEAPVDLVLTVKDTFDFLVPCLESVFQNTDVPFRLFLNDNASEDRRTPEYLRKIAAEHPEKVRLFLQDRDLGFSDAVNLLLEETSNDVILVNADTVMPPAWTSRLLWPIRHSGLNVASSVPFTNAAIMGSFPLPKMENDLLPGMDAAAMDRIFQRAKQTTKWRIPWSQGFCMALSRKALDEVGLLDAETFRPGYGEEVDWCCRATRCGYIHLLSVNLFVYHKHSATMRRMKSVDRDKLLAEHAAIVSRRYPDVNDKVYDFNDNPWYLGYCSYLLFLAGCEAGGGVSVRFVPYVELRRNIESDAPALLVAQNPDTGEYSLRFHCRGYQTAFTSPNLNWVIKMLYRVKVVDVVAEAFPLKDEDKVRQALVLMKTRLGIVLCGKDGNEIYET